MADPFDAERGFNALATTRALTEVAEQLSTIRGRRKSIVFISEGLDYDITDVMNNRGASVDSGRHPRRDRSGDPLECQHLLGRSAGPDGE